MRCLDKLQRPGAVPNEALAVWKDCKSHQQKKSYVTAWLANPEFSDRFFKCVQGIA